LRTAAHDPRLAFADGAEAKGAGQGRPVCVFAALVHPRTSTGLMSIKALGLRASV
jgi:hypothetical protein